MINGIEKKRDEHLKRAFDLGYDNAASSLNKMVKGEIAFLPLLEAQYQFMTDSPTSLGFVNRPAEGVLLTTEVFGDVFGKSYLLLSNDEVEVVTKGIHNNHMHSINLKDEFIKELDNILSAAVLTKLSNELSLKVYGDIPMLTNSFSGNLLSHIHDDFADQCDRIYINSIAFIFKCYPSIRPRFVWVLDNKITTLQSKLTH